MARKKALNGKLTKKKLREIVFSAGQLCLEKKASEVVVLDLKKISDVTDFFLIAEGYTDIHVRAVSEHVIENLEKRFKLKPWHVEGMEYARWVLMDYVDFVIHIFQPETRNFYQLERLWADSARHEIADQEQAPN
jgi:ribosome-associated protein